MVRRLKEDLRKLNIEGFPERKVVQIDLRNHDGVAPDARLNSRQSVRGLWVSGSPQGSGFARMTKRKTMTEELIQSDPAVMMGKPVVAGTRITVELILEKLGAGETVEQLLQAHPRLTREGIQAALSFAAQSLKADVVYPLKPTG
jgi:uncharacterized protein (DUF433 family)